MNKPGWKTTEFWMSMAAVVVSAIYASGVVDENNKILGLIASVLGALGYTASRAWVKSTDAKWGQISANPSAPPKQ